MQRQTIQTNNLSTLSWSNDYLIDWANSGRQYFADGQVKELGSYHFAFSFDSAITSEDGIYAVIYKKLGTKGLLLKNGQILREINRSYYQAEVYEYPIAFAKLKDGRNILIHCPENYCRLDFEEVETGNFLTNHIVRKPSDFFHSRLEVSLDHKTLLSKGWAWHPYDFIEVFDIEECIHNPIALDKSKHKPDVDAEICSASFITNDLVLIGSPNDTEPFNDEPSDKLKNGQIGIWNIKTNEVTEIIQPNFTIGGHLMAIDETFAWNLYENPKIINFKTGEIVDELKDIQSGNQISSIIHHLYNLPTIAFNRQTKQVAISKDNKIEILTK
ncbi:MAG: hypothetical protein EOO91_07255 [Pedobacter sp.]|nr:MAG: hypothetical protein EOO91_07255 [Pedobacter sp.]